MASLDAFIMANERMPAERERDETDNNSNNGNAMAEVLSSQLETTGLAREKKEH